ncbi:MAG: nucleotidyltransferase family protein [Chloroflexota bacterium]
MPINVQVGRPIGAVIAAAGQSRRMGQPKQLLPWGERTVIEAVVEKLEAAGVSPIVCVVGRRGAEIEQALATTSAYVIHNSLYKSTEMLYSFQMGIAYLGELIAAPSSPSTDSGRIDPELTGTLLSLGDQPHIPLSILRQICTQIQKVPEKIVIPSHQMRRGHPFFIPRMLWPQVTSLGQEESLRSLLQTHTELIEYVNLNSDAILADMDTPEDYAVLLERWL